MTSTIPTQRSVRDCRLYRFYVEHPVTGEEVLGYVGETIREPFERLMEHVNSQPWMDTVTRWERDPQVFPGKQAVLQAETEAIRAERPLYNVRGNEHNEDRIPPPVAIRQRRERDARDGTNRWVHPADQPVRVSGTRPGGHVSQLNSWCMDHVVRVKVCLWVIVWSMTTVLAWGYLDRLDLLAGGWAETVTAGAISLAMLGWGVRRKPDTWPMWRTRLRKARRALRRRAR